ncbi:M3 family metallopeptidase [Actinacidiphila acidipaludis]|uniref:M3 family metallopeptidase n=1 Tax=Actinacidiphila acidipaludis TaxID=2873382 RepID=A0ABS7QEK1_9ACTN|nr:M3 family metallopeptidase [Streptomyces acidipaludis]MBY8881119.1 M3 family metallopeptidase [Streptomyces acidipaludis]
MTTNPFLSPSTLPYELPPFADIRDEHYLPALEQGVAEHLAEVEAIAADPNPPSFDNTLVALERSGALLGRARAAFANQASAHVTPAVREIEPRVSALLAEHSDAVHLNAALFARIDALYETRHTLSLDPESLRLLERYHTVFVRAGARLSAADREKLRDLNARIAAASTEFGQNVLAAGRDGALVLDDATQLSGLSPDAVAAAAENGRATGHDGRWVLSLKNFSNQPELASLDDREVRRRLLTASLDRAQDTNGPLAVTIATLRAERAALLGYDSHAAYVVADRTAGSTQAVTDLLARLVPPAVANAQREAEALQELAGAPIEAWDWAYWSDKVSKERYEVDAAALRPYFELERVLHDGVFRAAREVYGITLRERPDLPGYHPDVRVFEVFDADGSGMGLFLADFFARESKRGGAWMNALVEQSELLGKRPVVVNNHNIPKPAPGEPALLTFTQVDTLFHEFGHALHGLFSAVRYPFFSGTSVPSDFVEFPSQVNEMWSLWPEILGAYAVHHETGEPMPADVVTRMREAARFGQGFATVEYLAATLLDWAWHTLPAGTDPGDPLAFEAKALHEAGLALPAIPPRYRTSYFSHIFASQYSAGYYSYIWSEVLDADTVDWFTKNGGMTRANGDTFRRELLARGGSVDPMAAIGTVLGRAPRVEPLLVRRGLTATT